MPWWIVPLAVFGLGVYLDIKAWQYWDRWSFWIYAKLLYVLCIGIIAGHFI